MPDPRGPWQIPPPAPRPPRPVRRISWAALLGLLAAIGLLVWGLVKLTPYRTLSGDDWATVSRIVLMLLIVSLGLLSRRLDLKRTVRDALIWAGIIVVLLVGFSFRDEVGSLVGRVRAELSPESAATVGPHEVAVIRAGDDNFYVLATVNGVPVRFLVDTGASGIVLTTSDARRLGVDVGALNFSGVYETANGLGRGAPFKADSLEVGDIRLSDVVMSINQAPMRTSLLGMTFFRRLESFEVRGSRLYMRWRP